MWEITISLQLPPAPAGVYRQWAAHWRERAARREDAALDPTRRARTPMVQGEVDWFIREVLAPAVEGVAVVAERDGGGVIGPTIEVDEELLLLAVDRMEPRGRWLDAEKESGPSGDARLDPPSQEVETLHAELVRSARRQLLESRRPADGSEAEPAGTASPDERATLRLSLDELTGLPARAMFEEFLSRSVARAGVHDSAVAVLHVDLDHFRMINDTLGHVDGDMVLCEVASRLSAASPEVDLVARLAGDEFLVLLADLETNGAEATGMDNALLAAETVASKLREALEPPVVVGETEVPVTASIGISIFPLDAANERALLKHAHAALLLRKGIGPDGYVVFPGGEAVGEKLTEVSLLRKAVQERQWALEYQPLVDLFSGHLIAVEALLRWRHPSGRIVRAAEFIPMAEELGLIEPIGEWVVEELGRQTAIWNERGIDVHISFNLSPRQLWRVGLLEQMVDRLETLGVDPRGTVVEITESAAMVDSERTREVMFDLRRRGLRFALDDFGTGYSSLSRLKDLPVQILKIDGSFVKDLPDSPEAATMVRAIIQLARNLGMTPVAECIETKGQWRFLAENGCLLGQGHLFSRPLPPDKVPEVTNRELLPIAA